MSEKNQKAINFLRRNVYYLVFILCLTVLTVITVALVVSGDNNSDPVGGNNPIEQPNETPNENPNETPNENPGDTNNPSDDTSNENPNDPKPNEPVVSVIVFDLPVNGTIIKDYVSAGVVYNQTLGLYSGHKAIDFGAEEGAQVFACYKGTIEEILVDKLEGTSVIIDHGNGLKTVYNSIEVDENLTVGASVEKGSLLGVVSTNNRKEYKDGPHLHFEVIEDGQKIDPYKYLLTEEK